MNAPTSKRSKEAQAESKHEVETLDSDQPSLKGHNFRYMWPFIGINLAVFLSILVSKQLGGGALESFWHRITAKDGIVAAGIPLLAIVLSGVFSDQNKARLVFWRWRHPLPGCRVFTQLIETDPRINVPALKNRLGAFPRAPQAQNALWYQLYKARQKAVTVFQAHRVYLLTRDMATVSAAFVVLFPIGLIANHGLGERTSILYVAALALQYLLTATAARNYGNRFVLNVLVEQSHATLNAFVAGGRQSS